MKLSAPIFQLKRRAKLMARNNDIPLHRALDDIAREEGFSRWSMLSSTMAAGTLSQNLLSRLEEGELCLIAGRPGQGKTLLGLKLLLDAVRAGRKAVFFTFEFTEVQAWRHLLSFGQGVSDFAAAVEIVASDDICADQIIASLSGVPAGAVVVIDYLQLLDQQRSKPPLAEQVRLLDAFARRTGVVICFLSQVDRSFDEAGKRLPELADIRLPNQIDLGLFRKACFLNQGEAQFHDVA
jgi:replicative DNA helicase